MLSGRLGCQPNQEKETNNQKLAREVPLVGRLIAFDLRASPRI